MSYSMGRIDAKVKSILTLVGLEYSQGNPSHIEWISPINDMYFKEYSMHWSIQREPFGIIFFKKLPPISKSLRKVLKFLDSFWTLTKVLVNLFD